MDNQERDEALLNSLLEEDIIIIEEFYARHPNETIFPKELLDTLAIGSLMLAIIGDE